MTYNMAGYPFGVFCDNLCMEHDCDACYATPLSRVLCTFWASVGWIGPTSNRTGHGMAIVGRDECARHGRLMHELSQSGNHWRYQWVMAACAMAFTPWQHVAYLGGIGRVDPKASDAHVRGNNADISHMRDWGRALLDALDKLDKVVSGAQRRIETHGHMSGVYLPGETDG
jgi:hypothetical protein